MAYSYEDNYEKTKKLYEWLDSQQQQEFRDRYSNDAAVQQFLGDYSAETSWSKTTGTAFQPTISTGAAATSSLGTVSSAASRLSKTSSRLNSINNTISAWGQGTYSYNPVSWYYEKVVNKSNKTSIPNMDENSDYYGILDNKAKVIPNTIYQWWKPSSVDSLLKNQTNNQVADAKVDLTWWNINQNINKWGDFNAAVNNKLQTAFWIQDLNALKQKYPEQYSSLVQALDSVASTWNALDPSQRWMLEWQLQAIIGTAVWAGSETSQLDVLSESILSKFKNPDQVKKFVSDVTRLKTEWMTTAEIAKQMWVSEDMVQQWILAANGLDNKLWEHFELTREAAKDITEDYDTQIERLEQEKEIKLERANRQIEWLKQDFDTQIERQKQANDIAAHNADFLSGIYWYWFSKRGIEWLNYVQTQAQQIIDDMVKNYDRNNQEMVDWVSDILRNWEWTNDDLLKASEDALTNAKNVYTSNMLKIQQQYWTVWMQAQQYLAENVQNFITTAEDIYDNALKRQQDNLTNLITNFSNLNALQYSNLTLRNAQIQQFQNESMNLNRSQLQGLAQQLGMDQASLQDLVNYQAQAVANQLNGYLPWSWAQFQSAIQNLLDSWYTPNQAISMIMNSDSFKALQSTWSWDNRSISGWIMYNKSTWEYMNLNGDEYATIWDNLYNKRTWEIISGKLVDGSNYVSSQVIDWKEYGTTMKTIQGLQNFYNNHQIGSKWWQCGSFVNDYLQSLGLWRVFTDPIDKKVAAINTPQWYKPQVWDVVVMDSPYEKTKQYGHVAIITWINDDWSFTTLESNKKNNDEKVFSRTIDPSKTKVYGYYHPDGAGELSGNGVGNMSKFDKLTAVTTIGRMVYWGNISDSESKRVEEIINEWDNAWLTENEIAYKMVWWKNINPEYQDVADNLAEIMKKSTEWMSWFDCRWIVDLINKWDIAWAIQKVEKTMYENDAKVSNSSLWVWTDADAIHLISSIVKIKQNIGSYDNKDEAFGWWDAIQNQLDTWVAWVWWEWSSRRLYNETKTDFANLFNEYRTSVFGSALTEAEIEESRKQLPDMSDKLSVVQTKLNAFAKSILSQVNARRTQLWLPTLDMNQLLDPSKRVELYWVSTNWLVWDTPIKNQNGWRVP